jgi:hypothetical protein
MAYDVFISYSSKDKPAADATCAVLEAEGIRCWIAPRDILPGQEWGASIVKAIANVKIFVLLLSSSANTSPQISREVERAVNHAIPVIPVRIEDVQPTASLEYFINTPHWLDAFKPPLDQHLAYLARVVHTLLEGGEAPPPPGTATMPPRATATAAPLAPPEAAPLPPAPVAPTAAPAARRPGSLTPILIGAAVLFLLIGLALAASRFLPRSSNVQVASAATEASFSSAADANASATENNGIAGQGPSIAPAVDPSCLAMAPSAPNPENCQAMLNENPNWQGCAATYADGDMAALSDRAQSLIGNGHSGVALYEASPDFRSYGTISHYWEMLSQCVHDGNLPFSQLSGGVSFPDSFWTNTRSLRAIIGRNWRGANQPLPDFMSNFQFLCEQYKASRDQQRPGGGDSLDCSS